MKTNSLRRVGFGVLVAMALFVGMVWVFAKTLGNAPQRLYAGKPIQYWQEQLHGHDPGASNEAFAVVDSQVIPQFTHIMFYDTNDSRLRIFMVQTLNGLPGVRIVFTEAGGRRARAARSLGYLGPVAKSAVPDLLRALKGADTMVHEPAIWSLGEIHSDPDLLIPLLMEYLEDESLNDEAALALANYGSLAKAAVPKIIPMLHAPDKDARAAGMEALKKIDPEAYTNAARAD